MSLNDEEWAAIKAEVENAKEAFSEWARQVIPILEKVKEENPLDLIPMRLTRLYEKGVPVLCELYREDILRIFRALGSDTTPLEEEFTNGTATIEKIDKTLFDLQEANQMIKILRETIDSDLRECSSLLELIIKLGLDALIHIVEWVLMKLSDSMSMKEIKTIFREVIGEDLDRQSFLTLKVWLGKKWLSRIVKQAKKIRASSPKDLETLKEEIEKHSVPFLTIQFGEFKPSGFLIAPAFLIRNTRPIFDGKLKQLEDYPVWCELNLLCVQIATDAIMDITEEVYNHVKKTQTISKKDKKE